ncbi:hypothetical protein N5P37_006192 [Trichoderma harzianum]|nr:hypothetical protein N5P37_006192 [Trichoderma harzianum]
MRSITGVKKRARTGCLSCRRRRRDEQKPRCSSCDTRGISCQYPDGLIFIPAPTSRYQGLRDPDFNQVAQTYDTIEFVENATFQIADAHTAGILPEPASVTAETPRPPFAPETVTPQRIDIQEEHCEAIEDSVALEDPDEEPRSEFIPSSNVNNASTVTVVSDSSPAVTPAARVNPTSPRKLSLEKASAYDFPTNFGLPPGDQEIALLRHFRDNLCPCLDIGGSKSAAGLDIMVLANSSKPLMSSILWLASEHYASISLQSEIDLTPEAVTYRQHATEGLELEPDDTTVKHIGHGLLTLKELLGSKPRQWTGILARSNIYDTTITFVPPEETIDSLFWALLKFDLAASIIGKQSPKISICTLRDTASRLTFRPGARYDCQASLLRLGECLHIVYGTDDSLSSVSNGSNRQESPTSETQLTNFWSQWTSLWRECQDWHKHRALEVQPLLVVDSIEMSSINTPDDPSFPMLLFTEPLALVVNITYYITSLLLLSRRPRLSRLWAHSSLVTSMAWHAQSIAGALTSNQYPESWDPVVFAGVLMAGKAMTHESQQMSLLKQLHKMINAVGLNLRSEVQELQSSWTISHHDSH